MLLFPDGSGFLKARSTDISQNVMTGRAKIKGAEINGVVNGSFRIIRNEPKQVVISQTVRQANFLIMFTFLLVLYTMG